MKTIVLDTNILHGNWKLRGKKLDTLLQMAAKDIIKICVPRVVVRELARQEHQHIHDAGGKLKSWLDMAPEFWTTRLKSEDGDECPQGKKAARRAWIDAELNKAGSIDEIFEEIRSYFMSRNITILDTSHPDISRLENDYFGERKPLKGGGEGVADWIIWGTMIDSLPSGNEVIFVSDNYSDFANQSSSRANSHLEIHPDMKGDTKKFTTFEYCRNLDQLLMNSLGPEGERLGGGDFVGISIKSDADLEDAAIEEAKRYLESLVGEECSPGDPLSTSLARSYSGMWKLDVDSVDVFEGDATWDKGLGADATAEIIGTVKIPARVVGHLRVEPENLSEFIKLNQDLDVSRLNNNRAVFKFDDYITFSVLIERVYEGVSVFRFEICDESGYL